MVEILWKSNAPHLPANDHEMVELRLIDLGSKTSPRFLVREIRAKWSGVRQQIHWNGYKDETFGTRQEAKLRFETRKAQNANAGYRHSTVLAA
jgi:hypothetical protein